MITLMLNGKIHELDADPDKPLLWVLRDEVGLKGTKYGCGVGVCGACVVLLDGEPNHACMVPLAQVGARRVTTIEGLPQDHSILQSWVGEQVPQCGYCQPAQIMTAAALLARCPHPSDAEIDEAMSGVLCRCGTYQRVRRAIHAAAEGKPQPLSFPTLPDMSSGIPDDMGVMLNDWIGINSANRITFMINHSEMGQGALTGLSALLAEELDIGLDQVRTVFAPADERYANGLFGGQFTGGSSSIRGEWMRLRTAGAQTRQRLIAAAARRWGIAAQACRTERGSVIHEGWRLTYGELAADAAREPAPAEPALKSPCEFRLIGKTMARLDIPAMAMGRARYGIDVGVQGMMVATVLRCPVFGGFAKAFAGEAALGIKGVRQVLAISSGIAVVADDFWSALRGRDVLAVQWDCGDQAQASDESIEQQLLDALNRQGAVLRERGDAHCAFASDQPLIEAVYRTPYLAHGAIEPMNCVAHVRGDGCDVWVGTQSQGDTQAVAARLAGLPAAKVRVYTQFLGGGFGRRLETDFVADAVELSKRLGVPVQVIWTRADDLQHDRYRPAHAVWLKGCLDGSGRPSAWFMRIAGSELALDGIHMPYAIPHYVEEHSAVSSPLPTGPWRSVGASNNAFVIEGFIDELAHRAGCDPFEFRLALLKDAPRHRAVLEHAVRCAGWGAPLAGGLGRGIAVYQSFGSVVAQVAEVRIIGRQIKVERVVCVIDCGIAVDPDAVRAQLEGGIAFGLSAALHEEIRIASGRVQQGSFKDYPILTLTEMPRVEAHILEADAPPGGVGEPAVPVIAPAVANAVFSATGQRLRRLPLRLA